MHPILESVSRILFYGDSLTDGSSYPDYVIHTLNRIYPEAGFEILNAAIAGNTAADLRRRLAADVVARDPDLVIVCIGTNDAHGKRPLGDFRTDLDMIVDGLRHGGIRVMLVLPSPFGDAELEQRFQDYLRVLRQTARQYDLPVADAHGLFGQWQEQGRDVLGADGIHHGKDGFEAMARAIIDALGLTDAPLDMTVTAWPGMLTDWETSAAVPLDRDYSPAEAQGWQPYDAKALMAAQPWWNSPFPARGGWMPFADSNAQQAAYGRTHYDAPDTGKYELQIGGSPAPQIVWLNGVKVWQAKRPHGYHPDAARVAVDMRKGRNELVGVSNFMLFLGVRKLD